MLLSFLTNCANSVVDLVQTALNNENAFLAHSDKPTCIAQSFLHDPQPFLSQGFPLYLFEP